jgi:hypothetical protein
MEKKKKEEKERERKKRVQACGGENINPIGLIRLSFLIIFKA